MRPRGFREIRIGGFGMEIWFQAPFEAFEQHDIKHGIVEISSRDYNA